MKIITSVHNEQIKHLINLVKKSYRLQHQQFAIEGIRAFSELTQVYQPIAIYVTDEFYKNNQCILNLQITTIVSDPVMEKTSNATTPSGIYAIFQIPTSKHLPKSGPGIILVNVSDPGNMGTLIRTAAAMNIKEVIIVGGTDPYSPKVIQSTAGCLAAINLHQTTFENLMNQNLQLCALVVKDGKLPDQVNLHNTFLVVGNEAHGLTDQHINACQQKITIPMPGQAESLNAGVAGSIGLYLMSLQN